MYAVEKVLMGQSVQTEDAVPENAPVTQALQVIGFDAPSTGDAVPAGQLIHAVPSFEKVPLAHLSTMRTELESVMIWTWPRLFTTS